LTNGIAGSYAPRHVDAGESREPAYGGRAEDAPRVDPGRMKQIAMRVGRVVLGVAFLLLGVVGLFLPFLQGILFLVIGLTLLSSESEYARHCLQWLRDAVERRRHKALGRASHGGK